MHFTALIFAKIRNWKIETLMSKRTKEESKRIIKWKMKKETRQIPKT
jgi:hypothetical protein